LLLSTMTCTRFIVSLVLVASVSVGAVFETTKYPEGYDGAFEVMTYTLMHCLYLALGSAMKIRLDIWELLNKNLPENRDNGRTQR